MVDSGVGFSAEEKAAMKQRAEELKSTKGVKGAAKTAKEYQACLDAIEALNVPNADDAEANWKHYANIYMLWRQHLVTAEREWDINAEGAAAELAALQDVAGFLFGPTGLIQHLDAIGFSLTPEDLEMMDAATETKDDSE